MLAARERLGVGRIVGEAISIFFRRIHFVVLLCILPELILNVIQMAAILVTNSVYEAENIETGIVYQIWQPIKRFAGLLLFSGFAGQMVYEMKNDGRIRIGGILSTGLRRLIPLSACALATGAFASLATFPIVFAIWIAGNSDENIWLILAAVIPSLYLLSLTVATTPSIMVENTGFGSLARSVQLTKNYRWSCTFVFFILILCGLAGQFILSAFVYKLNNQILLSDSSSDFYWLYSALHVVPNHSVAFFLAIPGIGSALIYFRLREIKEGTQSELVENVFA